MGDSFTVDVCECHVNVAELHAPKINMYIYYVIIVVFKSVFSKFLPFQAIYSLVTVISFFALEVRALLPSDIFSMFSKTSRLKADKMADSLYQSVHWFVHQFM